MATRTGTVTFLFTDVVGSTRLWESHADAMREALPRHDEIAQQIAAEHGGEVVRSRGEGDSLFMVFPRASDAVVAAADLQRAFENEEWAGSIKLQVRMAVHTGEVDYRDGDYYGKAVNRAARLRAIGHGGQVLVSDVTHDLCRDSLPASCSFRALGEHRLKDLGRPESVFQLLHPDLASKFPPLQTPDNVAQGAPAGGVPPGAVPPRIISTAVPPPLPNHVVAQMAAITPQVAAVGAAVASAGEAIRKEVMTQLPWAGGKVATPMLDSFLRQVNPPVGQVSPPWMDIPLAIGAFVAVGALPFHGGEVLPAGLAAWGMLRWRRSVRDQQIAQQPAHVRTAWERWQRVSRLVALEKKGELRRNVPAQVLEALEQAARSWHETTEELRSIGVTDATFATEIQGEVDAIMLTAAAAAEPVVRQDKQGRRYLRQIEADSALMGQVCLRINREGQRLRRWAEDASAAGKAPASTLRDRLAMSQRERAAAEAELDGRVTADMSRF